MRKEGDKRYEDRERVGERVRKRVGERGWEREGAKEGGRERVGERGWERGWKKEGERDRKNEKEKREKMEFVRDQRYVNYSNMIERNKISNGMTKLAWTRVAYYISVAC